MGFVGTSHYFIALELPSFVKERIQLLKEEWCEVRSFKQWTHTQDYHLTLTFLGSVEVIDLQSYQQRLADVVTTSPSFTVRIDQVNDFGHRDAPRIFWVGPERSKPLLHLYDLIQNIVTNVCGSIENRPFRPHITLAKKWQGKERFQLPNMIDPIEFTANTVSLFRIHPKNTPKYEVVAQYKLATQ